jgi:sensor histidine kinase YesM
LAQTEMKALHSQMNPHFIFNCLNSIREMILNNETKPASHYLSKFAQLIRITLDNSTKPFVSLKNTIDYLQRYLEMEQIRTNYFTYTIEVDEELQAENIFLPPMLIQPFIENAIWHGAHPNKPIQLSIAFLQKNHELVCIIEDDGIGIETSLKNKGNNINHQSIGISNIKHRISLLNEKYHFHSTVSIEDKSAIIPKNGTGTKVTLHLPAKHLDL